MTRLYFLLTHDGAIALRCYPLAFAAGVVLAWWGMP